ncbi:MAG: CDP-diacylglycerol--glycerol-3-phosphate 3-phosphatidyltransferase [Gemmatimonadota bacterium]|nr:MAG: CDP-diacylglycerol--glycerol-3-phosphate 3-phosphatidyltransferase [Gemmatimonadota bacterium]
MNLPNGITVARILAAPVIFVLILSGGFGSLLAAFVLFVTAAVSDIWDGYLARRRGQITDFGKLADPIADKLLVVSTFVPFYIVSLRAVESEVPVVWGWGVLPLWVLLVVLGRELLITVFRGFAKRKGVVIAAGKEGKYKALFQDLFIGGEILWLALRSRALERGWDSAFWSFWKVFHGSYVTITLAIAVLLTAYSLGVYLWRYRALVTRPGQ